jgi:class 3 adenylate cyclase
MPSKALGRQRSKASTAASGCGASLRLTDEEGSMKGSEDIQTELDRRVHHLKTLYDVSKELFGIIDSEGILRNFLLMTTGNFGVVEGFILTQDIHSKETAHFVCIGCTEHEQASLSKVCSQFMQDWNEESAVLDADELEGLGQLPEKLACVLPFKVDEGASGVLGLGAKIVGEPYNEEDKELLATLINNLVVALGNARAFEDIKRLNQEMQEKNIELERALNDLDRRVYHLKTLYDMSKDIFGSVDFAVILKNFLLMTMGNFGVMKAFLLTIDAPSGEITHFRANGYMELNVATLRESARQLLLGRQAGGETGKVAVLTEPQDLIPEVVCGVPFRVDEGCLGFLGLGTKLVDEPYNEDDRELLATLVNNLVVSLKNAISFENIKSLNLELQEKNKQLEKALKHLQAALKKIELLESIKANLSKFVPITVTTMIEKSPTGEIQDSEERDISVLFLDIEGYTKITEEIGATAINELIERYFSVFMDAIYANNGDVNETAGDGLMVLYLSEDKKKNAVEAVRTALTIRDKTVIINKKEKAISEPLLINMGVSSGRAFVGAAKFDSLTGSRWTYTSHGKTTNVAARICSQATGGEVLLSGETAERVKDTFPLQCLGKFCLKNLSEEVEIYAV